MATAKVEISMSKKISKDALPTATKPEKEHLIVAAIDFGTTFTGYAFSAKKLLDNKINCSLFRSERFQSEKAPTCVLLNSDETFSAFGYDAEEKYEELCLNNESDGYHYFERFKMNLYKTKKLSRETKIKDQKGKELLAIDVFSKVIKHLSEELNEQLRKQMAGIAPDDVLWVITIPAIWSYAAKQFMREAANKADIRDDDIKLALEPEAASLYCNMQMLCKFVKFDGKMELDSFPVGHRYIVADLGGGSADLAVHEILDDHNLREIARSDGDAYGGFLVDKAFQEFLSDFFGLNVVQHLIETHGYMKFRRKFETKKRVFKSDKKWINITIPLLELKDACEACSVSYNDIVREANAKYTGKAQIKRDMFQFSADIMKGFFDKAVDGIVKLIAELRSTDELSITHTVLLVGGFSGSQYVQERIQNDIPGVRIVIPIHPSVAVLKGAVLYGKNPRAITERKARFSYGFSVARHFDEGTDPKELKIIIKGGKYCNNAFAKLITKGELIKQGEVFGDSIDHGLDTDTDSASLLSIAPAVVRIFKSTKVDPKYTTAEDCEELGKLIIRPTTTGWPFVSTVDLGLIVGESELQAFAFNVKTKLVREANFYCL